MSFDNSKASAFILIKFCLIDPGINLLLILELLALYFFLVLPYLSYAFMSRKCRARIIVCLLHCNMSVCVLCKSECNVFKFRIVQISLTHYINFWA